MMPTALPLTTTPASSGARTPTTQYSFADYIYFLSHPTTAYFCASFLFLDLMICV